MSLIFRVMAAGVMMVLVGVEGRTGGKTMEANGTFEVKVTPAEATAFEKGMGTARYEMEKTWVGDFVGTSKGEMLTSFTERTGAMAYVAMEQVTGRLGGKSGSFYFAHTAVMTKGDASSGVMRVVVVKGSGTGELAGLSGELRIIVDGKGGHSYEMEYEVR